MFQNTHAMRDAVSASGEMTVDWGPQGLQITDGRPRPVWGRITGVAAGTNRYSWTQVNESDSTLPDLGSGFAGSGTTTVGQWPAYEVTGNTLVSVGTKVMLWPSPSGQFWIFFFPTAITVGGLVVEAVDLAPSYTSITDIRFDELDGFQITQPAAGIARIDIRAATTTQAGVVSTAAQSFDGDKTFEANVNTTDGILYVNVNNLEANVAPFVVYAGGYVDGGPTAQPAILVTGDTTTNYVDTSDRQVVMFGTGATTNGFPGELRIDGVIKLLALADADVPNDCLFNSSTGGKWAVKDSGGTVHYLW